MYVKNYVMLKIINFKEQIAKHAINNTTTKTIDNNIKW